LTKKRDFSIITTLFVEEPSLLVVVVSREEDNSAAVSILSMLLSLFVVTNMFILLSSFFFLGVGIAAATPVVFMAMADMIAVLTCNSLSKCNVMYATRSNDEAWSKSLEYRAN
jgi:hypothetical protein